MKIWISTQKMLKLLSVIAWIIFIGLCMEAGAFIFNVIVTIVFDPVATHNFFQEVDLSALYAFDKGHFVELYLVIIIVTIMKACIFYLAIKALQNIKLNLSQPFNKEVSKFITLVCYLAMVIGLLSEFGSKYSEWFRNQGVTMPDLQNLQLGGSDVWMLMSVILFVILQIFKRGIEIQSENELTV
jgi:hypothetical protein